MGKIVAASLEARAALVENPKLRARIAELEFKVSHLESQIQQCAAEKDTLQKQVDFYASQREAESGDEIEFGDESPGSWAGS